MNNPIDKKLEKVFKEEFENFEPTPSAHVWENIEKGLAKAEKKPFPWMRIAASVIVLFVIGWMGMGILEDPSNNKDIFVKSADQKNTPKAKTTKPEQGMFKIISSGKSKTNKVTKTDKTVKPVSKKASEKKVAKKAVKPVIKSKSELKSKPIAKVIKPATQEKIEQDAPAVILEENTSAQALVKLETVEPEIVLEEAPLEIIEEKSPEVIASAPASNIKEIEVKRALDVAIVAADRINNDKIKFAKVQTEGAQEYSYNINLGFISWSGKKTVSN